MITIFYHHDGDPVSDFEIKEWVYSLLEEHDSVGSVNKVVSNSLPIHAIRLEVARGNLDCDDVKFIFGGREITCNPYGAINRWPNGFADIDTDYCEKILKEASTKRILNRRD
jgi:hypothetical protein